MIITCLSASNTKAKGDSSASTKFGTTTATKAGVIAEISALLAFSAIRNDDRSCIPQTSKR